MGQLVESLNFINIYYDGKYPKHLSNDDIGELCVLANDGDIDARNRIISSFYKFIGQQVQKYSTSFILEDPDDLFQIGIMSCIKAIKTYKSETSKFITYFSNILTNDLLMALRKQNNKLKKLSYLSDIIIDDITLEDTIPSDLDIEQDFIDNDYIERFSKLFEEFYNSLSNRDKILVDYSYGLHGKPQYSCLVISQLLKLSRTYIYRLLKDILMRFTKILEDNDFDSTNISIIKFINKRSIIHGVPTTIPNLDQKYLYMDDVDKFIIKTIYGYKNSSKYDMRSILMLLGWSRRFSIDSRLKWIASDEFTCSKDLTRPRSRIDDITEIINNCVCEEYKPIIIDLYGLYDNPSYSITALAKKYKIKDTNIQARINKFYIQNNINYKIRYDIEDKHNEIIDRYFGLNGYNEHSIEEIVTIMKISRKAIEEVIHLHSFKEATEEEIIANVAFDLFDEMYPNLNIIQQILIDKYYKNNSKKKISLNNVIRTLQYKYPYLKRRIIIAYYNQLEEYINDRSIYDDNLKLLDQYREKSLEIYPYLDKGYQQLLDDAFGLHSKPILPVEYILYNLIPVYGIQMERIKNKQNFYQEIYIRITEILKICDDIPFLIENYKSIFPKYQKYMEYAYGINDTPIVLFVQDIIIRSGFEKTSRSMLDKYHTHLLNHERLNSKHNIATKRQYRRGPKFSADELNTIKKNFYKLIGMQRVIVGTYYGLFNNEPRSITQIAKELSIKPANCNRIFHEGVKICKGEKVARYLVSLNDIIADNILLIDIINANFDKLSDMEKEIIGRVYGLNGYPKSTIQHIASKMHRPYTYINQLRIEIIKMMIEDTTKKLY